MIGVRSLIFVVAAAAGCTATAWAQPTEPVKMAEHVHGQAACAAPAELSPALAGWNASAKAVTAVGKPGQAGKAVIASGEAVAVTLLRTPSVRFAVAPSKPGGSVSFGGMLAFDVAEEGTYRVAQDARSWVDVIEGGKVAESVAHGHGPECSGIAKMVDFKLSPGRHILQVSANGAQTLKVMVARLP